MPKDLEYLQKHFQFVETPEAGSLITGYREHVSVYPEIWIRSASPQASTPLGRFYGRLEWQLFASFADLIFCSSSLKNGQELLTRRTAR